MPTLRASAELLAAANSIDALAPIAAAVGCDGTVSPLDDATRRALGIAGIVRDARIAAGHGALRALLLDVSGAGATRDVLPRLASRLSARAPHVLWLVIAIERNAGDVAIAAWTDDRRPPRLAALVANRARVVDSDAETLRALTAVATPRDLLTHARWVEVLGRDALSARFYRELERAVSALAASTSVGSREARAEIALLDTSRLLFLAFLEAKGWLNGDRAFLTRQFDACLAGGGRFHERVLRPLFFGTLNTVPRRRSARATAFGSIPFLNGGLFARTAIERRHRGLAFSDDACGALLCDVFGQYRFTAREETTAWSEAAVDPEMLGRAFESLMVAPERRRTGAFFTPFSLVERLTSAGLDAASTTDLDQLTVLDPACGSGAFLVHALERIAAMRIARGDSRDLSTVRRDVLVRSIFGVDVNPTAVWLCELRLWLSVVIESEESDPESIVPLPNLDRNIRVGDALAGRAFDDRDARIRGGAELRRLHQRYAKASGPRKDGLARQLDRAERGRALLAIDADLAAIGEQRRDLLIARRGRDLFGEPYHPSPDERLAATVLRRRAAALRTQRRRITAQGALPFAFPVHFGDIASRGGFRLVVGNPPWVRLHHIPAAQRADLRRDYEVARRAAWEPGAAPAGAGRGFAAQVDIAAVFVERSTRLLAQGGALALLLPVKLWRSLAGGGARRWIAAETHLLGIEDHSEGAAGGAFDAAVYPSLLIARRQIAGDHAPPPHTSVAVHRHGHDAFAWQAPVASLPFDSSPGAPWILLPRDARKAFDIVRAAGEPLASSPIGRPHLGVKCGCNEAFIVAEIIDDDATLAEVRVADGERVIIERAMLRPLLRGEHLRRWVPSTPPPREHLIWTHDATGAPLSSLPPLAAKWLARWRRRLVARTDARRCVRWWSLFRTESARCVLPRVVWGDVGREPRASVLHAGDRTVPLNSCYVAFCRDMCDAYTLTTLLNGPLARAWLNALAEPARGGYRRYLGWTLSLLPTPRDWERARAALAPLGERAVSGRPPSESELLRASLEAYGLRREVAPLVAWLAE